MGGLLLGLGALLGLLFDSHQGVRLGIAVALILWCGLYLLAVFHGNQLLLLSMGAREIRKEDAPRLWNIVEEMCLAAGLKSTPHLYVIDDHAPNAFAVGMTPQQATIAVSSGLLRRLNRDELQGVVAHEIAHISHQDTTFLTLASMMLGSIVLLSDIIVRTAWLTGGPRRLVLSRSWWQAKLLVFGAILAALIAPICARLLYFACARQREYLADATAAQLTRYPHGLASALEKLFRYFNTRQAVYINRALVPACIVAPFREVSPKRLFATHPPTALRIKILRSMGGGADYAAYETAFQKVCGKGTGHRPCLDARTLRAAKSLPAREPNSDGDDGGASAEGAEDAEDALDLLDRFAEYIPIHCSCGVCIKVPPALHQESVRCPRCGQAHTVPRARYRSPDSVCYTRRETGWELFKCVCNRVVQLSPSFIATSVPCPRCRQPIQILRSVPVVEDAVA